MLAAALPAAAPAQASEVVSAPFRTVAGVEVVAPPVPNGSMVGRDQPGVTTVLRLTGEPQEVAEAFAAQVCDTDYGVDVPCGAQRLDAAGAELWLVYGAIFAGGPAVQIQVRREQGATEGLVLLQHAGDSCGAC